MSLKDLMISDVSDVFLQLDDFADTIIRYVGGDAGNVKTFTGIVTIHPAMASHDRGRGTDQAAELVLSSDVALAAGDAIKFGDERYEVKAVSDPEHGMKTASLYRYIPEMRGGKVLRSGDL